MAKTHATLLQNIDTSRLSKAHQHGIQVARELDYRYIWIDALCILQDSQDDWKEQSKSTAEVYGNADLTIVAGRSDDSRNGFLKPLHDSGVYVQVPYLSANRPDLKTCWIGPPRNHHIGPTTGRGWCYQETLMSRRMDIYGEQQLSFRRRERHDFEGGHFEFVGASDHWYDLAFQILGDTGDETWAKSFRLRNPRAPLHEGLKPDVLKRQLLDPWHRIISEYSCLSFFESTDNHAALSGLARQFQKAFERRFGPDTGRYMAGLWELDMPGALLWRSKRIIDPDLPALQYPMQNGVAVYKAPSWSWMALVGPVYHNIGSGRGYAGMQPRWRTPVLEPENSDGKTWSPDPNGWGPSMIHRNDSPFRFTLNVKAWIRKVRVSRFQPADFPALAPWFPKYEKCKRCMNKHTILLELEENKPLVKKIQDQRLDQDGFCAIVATGLLNLEYAKGCVPSTMWAMSVTSEEGLLLERTVDRRDGSVVFKRLGVFTLENEFEFHPKGAVPMGRDTLRKDLLPLTTIALA